MASGKSSDRSNLSQQKDKIDKIIDIISDLQNRLVEAKYSEGIETLTQLRNDLAYRRNTLNSLKKFENNFSRPIEELQLQLQNIQKELESDSFDPEQIRKIRKQWYQNISSTQSDARQHPQAIWSKNLPNLCQYTDSEENFKESCFFQELLKGFEDLPIRSRLCLLCFAVFPENAVIKKRVLVHWWIGERLLDLRLKAEEKDKTAEEIAAILLQDFEAKGFIHSIDKRHRKFSNRFKMYPHVRSAVIVLAKEDNLFNFDSEGNPTSNFEKCDRVCLVYAEKENLQERLKSTEDRNRIAKIRTLFNVSEEFPDFKFEEFSQMKGIRVLCLGNWRSSDEHCHIEVESYEYLKSLKNMQDLRLLSLRGISGIRELPFSVSPLTSLNVLDVGACDNLEKLPKGIGSLRKLTHLDISECYLLDGMPNELCSLSELEVFKGFVISDATERRRHQCTLENLKKLKKLRKLSVSINSVDFPTANLSTVLKFENLVELKVSWGWGSSLTKSDNKSINQGGNGDGKEGPKSPAHDQHSSKSKLEKLDLQCFPDENLPGWLKPEALENLKNLYIRGGRLNTLSKNLKWEKVKVLRLKFLNELKINWRELKQLFPNLVYLERFKCPKVTFCSCDGYGVWVNSEPSYPSDSNEENA